MLHARFVPRLLLLAIVIAAGLVFVALGSCGAVPTIAPAPPAQVALPAPVVTSTLDRIGKVVDEATAAAAEAEKAAETTPGWAGVIGTAAGITAAAGVILNSLRNKSRERDPRISNLYTVKRVGGSSDAA